MWRSVMSSTTWKLGLWVWIPINAWLYVRVCYLVYVEALRWAEPYQMSETFKFPVMDSQLEHVTEPKPKHSDWLWAGRQSGRSSSPGRVKSSFSPRRRDRLWCPPSLLTNGYGGLFPRGLSGRGVKMTSHLQLVPRSRKYGSIHPLPPTPLWRGA
jgi:hypothetical protein